MRLSIFLVLLAGCSGDGGGGGGPDAAGTAGDDLQFCVDETNRYRAMVGAPAVARSAALEEFAAEGAAEDSMSERAHGHFMDTNGGGIAFGENACPSWLGWDIWIGNGNVRDTIAACLEAFWDEGPGGGHYEIMTDESYTTLGCGLYQDGSSITIIQDYGF
jgi:hypothetical protein